MGLADVMILGVIGAVLALAGWYIYSAKKKGKKCIGCPGNCDSCNCR